MHQFSPMSKTLKIQILFKVSAAKTVEYFVF